jgi:hypothetical protein
LPENALNKPPDDPPTREMKDCIPDTDSDDTTASVVTMMELPLIGFRFGYVRNAAAFLPFVLAEHAYVAGTRVACLALADSTVAKAAGDALGMVG